jgi:hypothetical protein
MVETVGASWHNRCMKLPGPIREVETIAQGLAIREYARLVEQFGGRHWKKCKGQAQVAAMGRKALAEVHWYECQGFGRVKMKVKRWL